MHARDLVQSLTRGRAEVDPRGRLRLRRIGNGALARKLRAAYAWISTAAIRPAYTDMHLGATTPLRWADDQAELELSHQGSYAAFLLMPLLTLATRRRLLLLGAPGRGKTSVAMLMGLLAGQSPGEVRRGIQRGHPQLTAADLLGAPLPGRLVEAREAGDVEVLWKRWLTQPVKIVDEYNRIPTKTQAVLLSLLSEGYAESFEQVVECGPSAWFLTANDDLGGGTFPVIEALRDRLDAAVRCHPMQREGFEVLLARVEGAAPARPPAHLVFTAAELDQLAAEVREVPLPEVEQGFLSFLSTQLEFCARASTRLEHMSKDSLRVGGRRVAAVCTRDCALDRARALCSQTGAGLSARALEAAVHYAKALAYFQGAPAVTAAHLDAVLPWVLHERLPANPQAPAFEGPRGEALRGDRAAWLRTLVAAGREVHASAARDLARQRAREGCAQRALEAAQPTQLEAARCQLEERIEELRGGELNAVVHQELVRAQALHAALAAALAVAV